MANQSAVSRDIINKQDIKMALARTRRDATRIGVAVFSYQSCFASCCAPRAASLLQIINAHAAHICTPSICRAWLTRLCALHAHAPRTLRRAPLSFRDTSALSISAHIAALVLGFAYALRFLFHRRSLRQHRSSSYAGGAARWLEGT